MPGRPSPARTARRLSGEKLCPGRLRHRLSAIHLWYIISRTFLFVKQKFYGFSTRLKNDSYYCLVRSTGLDFACGRSPVAAPGLHWSPIHFRSVQVLGPNTKEMEHPFGCPISLVRSTGLDFACGRSPVAALGLHWSPIHSRSVQVPDCPYQRNGAPVRVPHFFGAVDGT